MSNPIWKWLEDDGVTENATFDFAPVNGIPTDPIVRRLYNNPDAEAGGAGSGDFLITVLSRDAGVGAFTASDELAANGFIKVQIVDSGGTGIVGQTTSLTPVGKGRFLLTRAIPEGAYREFQFVADVPLGYGMLAKEWVVDVIEGQRAISLEMGHYEGGAHGIRMGLGDLSVSGLAFGGDIEPAGSPDNTVTVRAFGAVQHGVPSIRLDEVLTFNDEDADAVSLSTDEHYAVLVAIDDQGDLYTEKAPLAADPPSETEVPALPDGFIRLGHVFVPFSGEISDAEIDQAARTYAFGALIGTGLSPELHPYEALLGNAIVVVGDRQPIALVDDSVNRIWVDPTGANYVSDTQPGDLAQLWYEVTMASGVQTALRDCRPFLYPNPVEVVLKAPGTLSAADELGFGVLSCRQQAYLLPIGGICASVGLAGGSSGATIFDIHATNRNTTYASIFPDSGTQDERPTIAYDATEPTTFAAKPQRLTYSGGDRFKLEVAAIPGTASKDGTVVLKFSGVGAA